MTAPSRLDQLSAPEALRQALDTESMSTRLAGFLDGGAQLRVVSAQVLGSSSDARMVVAYKTAGPDGTGPPLIGKVFADPERGRWFHDLLAQLDGLDRASHECGVPRPIAWLSEMGMSLYIAARGRTLDQLRGAERRDAMVAAARWLAALHGLKIHLDRRLDLAAETRNLTEWASLVGSLDRAAADKAGRLLEEVVSAADRVEVSTAVPIHKDFHYGHVLFDQGRVVVIDFDEARAGDPAFDVAHFIANLRLLGIREGQGNNGSARLESAFLDGYVARTGYQHDRRHDFFQAYTCLKIAKQLVRGRGPAPAPTGAEVSRQVELILSEGLRCLQR